MHPSSGLITKPIRLHGERLLRAQKEAVDSNLRALHVEPFLITQLKATNDDFSEKLPLHYPDIPFYREWPEDAESKRSFWVPLLSGYDNFLSGHNDFSVGLMLAESGKIVSLTAYGVENSEVIHINAGSPPIVDGRHVHLKNPKTDSGLCLIIGSKFLNHPETLKHKRVRQSGNELKDMLSLVSGSASLAIGHQPRASIFQMIRMFARENGFIIGKLDETDNLLNSGFMLRKRPKLKISRRKKQ